MATAKKRRKKKSTRTVEQYLESARNLSALVPKLKKYRKRKTLKPSEKAAITRREKQLRGVTNLFPLNKKQAKKLKGKVFAPGIQAIRLRGVKEGAKIKISNRGDVEIQYDNLHWIYWPLDRDVVRSRPGMRDAGKAAFDKQFPIEKISDMATVAFNRMHIQGVSLWTHGGRADAVFDDLPAFVRWVNEKWSAGRYMRIDENGNYQDASDPGKWVNGIAILLEDPEYTQRRKTANAEKTTSKNKKRNSRTTKKGRTI